MLPCHCPEPRSDFGPCLAVLSTTPVHFVTLNLWVHRRRWWTTPIDVTIAFHNSHSADHTPLPGSAANARYAAEATSYSSDYHPPPNDVQLLFFSVETAPLCFLQCCLHSSPAKYLGWLSISPSSFYLCRSWIHYSLYSLSHLLVLYRKFLPLTRFLVPHFLSARSWKI